MRWACVAIAVLTVAAAPLASARAPQAACTSAGLVVWLDTNGDGAAGSTYFKLQMTNLSGHTCTLFGYPGVSGIGLGGGQLGSAAARDTAQPARRVTLASGATAKTTLRIADVLNYPAATCRPAMAAGLRVYPPGQRAAKIVPFPFRACSRPGAAYLTVRAVGR
jgi:hypothetical protein